MPQTQRQIFLNVNGTSPRGAGFAPVFEVNYNWPAINRDSVVMVTASECRLNEETQSYTRFVGDARIWVSNIAPHGPPETSDGGVTFNVVIEWYAQPKINVCVDITVMDDLPLSTSVERLV
jgi:hypothetical protein